MTEKTTERWVQHRRNKHFIGKVIKENRGYLWIEDQDGLTSIVHYGEVDTIAKPID